MRRHIHAHRNRKIAPSETNRPPTARNLVGERRKMDRWEFVMNLWLVNWMIHKTNWLRRTIGYQCSIISIWVDFFWNEVKHYAREIPYIFQSISVNMLLQINVMQKEWSSVIPQYISTHHRMNMNKRPWTIILFVCAKCKGSLYSYRNSSRPISRFLISCRRLCNTCSQVFVDFSVSGFEWWWWE